MSHQWRRWSKPGLNSWFMPVPSDPVHTHAGVSSPLAGTKSRSGASSLQTVGPPLHLLFQLLLLLLQATWCSEPTSALLTSNLFFFCWHNQEKRLWEALGTVSTLWLWVTARHEATPLSYCKRLISRRQTGREKIPRQTSSWEQDRSDSGTDSQNHTDSFLVIFHSYLLCKWQQRRRVLPASRLSTGEQPGCLGCHTCQPTVDPCFTLPSNHEAVILRNQPPGNQEATWVHPVSQQGSRHCWMANEMIVSTFRNL